MKRVYLLFILALLLTALFPGTARANTLERDIPPGFMEITSDVGVVLFRKNYPGGSPDYVQIVDISQGASLVLLHGSVEKKRSGKGMFGGYDPRLTSKPLNKYWDSLKSINEAAFCVSNGQFFYMREYPTRLPFSLKVDGEILSDGYGYDQHVGDQLILEIWDDRLDISELNNESLYNSSAPNIIAGLTEDAKKQKKRYTGRTFVGIDDYDQNGIYETLLIYTSKTARQVDASNVLKDFGADKMMMLDGGGSTQLVCNGKSYISSDRLIPQAIGVVAGGGQSDVVANLKQPGQVDVSTNTQVAEPIQSNIVIQHQALLPFVGLAPSQNDSIAQDETSKEPIYRNNIETEDSAPLYSASGLADILLIPLTMSPVLAILVIVISRTRYQIKFTDS
jgi:hypothetical protein